MKGVVHQCSVGLKEKAHLREHIGTNARNDIGADIQIAARGHYGAGRRKPGSIGVSIVSNVLTHRSQFHQNRLVESVLPSSVQYQDTLHRMTDYFVAQGNSLLQAQQQAVQWIGQQVQTQASFLAYMDAFWVLMLISLSAVPLALALRKVKLGGPVHVGH
jgi:MFS transporter, DHA2 family, multidrug resistance protein